MTALLNPQDLQSVTLSGTGLTATGSGGGGVRTIAPFGSGQYYWEQTLTTISSSNDGVGASIVGENFTFLALFATNACVCFVQSGGVTINQTSTGQSLGACANGDVIGVAYSATHNAMWFRKNGGTWLGTAAGADPASNLHGFDVSALATPLLPCVTNNSGDVNTVNFGATPFQTAAPVGFTGVPGAPGLDNAASGNGSASPATFSLATSLNNTIIAVVVYIENNGGAAPQVSTITGGGLSFAPRARITQPTGGRTELWWASAPTALGATTFTVTLAGATDTYVFGAFGVMGCGSQTKPWDSNAVLAGSETNGNSSWTPTIPGMSTTSADDFFIIAVGADANFASGSTPPSGFTVLQRIASGGSGFADLNTNYQQVSATISNHTFTWGSSLTPAHSGQVIFDALAGDVAAIVGNVMSSIIT